MRTLSCAIMIVFLAVAVTSCHKIESLPDRPHIEFTSFAVFDTTDILGNSYKGGRLNFYFEDGDGDLGLNEPVDQYDDSVNMFFELYRKSAGTFTMVPENDPMSPSDYRIPYMERIGQNKILKGTISVTFMYFSYSPAANDTIMYEFCIRDRARNYSDTVTTCEIPLSYNAIYN